MAIQVHNAETLNSNFLEYQDTSSSNYEALNVITDYWIHKI